MYLFQEKTKAPLSAGLLLNTGMGLGCGRWNDAIDRASLG
jgi:hypothetical protein